MAEAASASDVAGEELEVIQFTLSGTEYAIPVAEGNTIIEPKATTRVPRSADSVDGVMDYRGEVAVIIDLHAVLGVERTTPEAERDDRIILLDDAVDNQTVGVRTEDVIGVRTFDADYLRENVEKVGEEEEETIGVDEQFLDGVFTVTVEDDGEEHVEEIVELLNIEAVLADVRESSRLELQQTK